MNGIGKLLDIAKTFFRRKAERLFLIRYLFHFGRKGRLLDIFRSALHEEGRPKSRGRFGSLSVQNHTVPEVHSLVFQELPCRSFYLHHNFWQH